MSSRPAREAIPATDAPDAERRQGATEVAPSPARAEVRQGEPDSSGRSKAYLHAGHLFISSSPTAVTTILGSCVAVSLWDPETRIGGLNHFLLPTWVGEGSSSPRFGNVAMHRLIDDLIAIGGSARRLQAKVFGGACVLKAFDDQRRHLGQDNVEVALEVLRERNIPVVAQAVGGRRGRKLIFHTDEGVAWVKNL
jgi:chemotaxis protein CheD